MGRHLTRWLIPLTAILFAFWPTAIGASHNDTSNDPDRTTTTTTTTTTSTLPTSTTTTTIQVQISTTTSVESTTTTTTTTVPLAPTTTLEPRPPPQTTTSSPTTSLLPQPTTTTTVAPVSETTVEETSTTTYPNLPDTYTTQPDQIPVPTSLNPTEGTTDPFALYPTVPESDRVPSSVVRIRPVETTSPKLHLLPETDTQQTLPPTVESSSPTTILHTIIVESHTHQPDLPRRGTNPFKSLQTWTFMFSALSLLLHLKGTINKRSKRWNKT